MHPIWALSVKGALLLWPFGLLLLILAAILCLSWYPRFLGISGGAAFRVLLVALGIVAIIITLQFANAPWVIGEHNGIGALPILGAQTWLVLLLVPLLVKLYRKWVGGHLTAEEQLPGVEGMRAWLRGGNLVCALGIAVCAWAGFAYSFWGVLALTLMGLLAYPVVHTLTQPATPIPPLLSKADDLSQERERVLRMLEEGKITAEESAELVNALGQTVAPRPPPPPEISPSRKMMLVGVALVLIGFFLPWFSLNPGLELTRLAGRMTSWMGSVSPRVINLGPPLSGHPRWLAEAGGCVSNWRRGQSRFGLADPGAGHRRGGRVLSALARGRRYSASHDRRPAGVWGSALDLLGHTEPALRERRVGPCACGLRAGVAWCDQGQAAHGVELNQPARRFRKPSRTA